MKKIQEANIVLKNATIFDPKNNIVGEGSVAILKNKIAAVGDTSMYSGSLEIDVKKRIVCPGVIDIHTHIYPNGTWNGIPADLYAIPMGITAAVDAGSSGVANYKGLLSEMDLSHIHTKMMLNVAPCGIISPLQFAEPIDYKLWDYSLFDKAVEQCEDRLIAFKMRANAAVLKEGGIRQVDKLVQLAEHYHKRAVVHVTDSSLDMETIAQSLRPGDVFCHVFHGMRDTIIDSNGCIKPGIWTARKRGVLFDAAPGRGNFSLRIAKQAIDQGFLPDTISSDITYQNWHNPIAGTLVEVINKFLALGMELKDCIRCVTIEPAKQFGLEGAGALDEDSVADITVFEESDSESVFKDRFANEVIGRKQLVPKMTIIDGQILYRAIDL